jgi:hypothetical protein
MSRPGLGRRAERGGLRLRDWMDAELHTQGLEEDEDLFW